MAIVNVTTKRLRCAALLVAAAVALAPRVASAQQWVCYAFSAGETAAGAALRIAGDADDKDHKRFQILDLSVSKFVPKSRYDRIRPGWVACTRTRGGPVQLSVAPTAARDASSQPLWIGAIADIRFDPFWFLLILLVMTSFALYEAGRRWKQTRAAIVDMTQFGTSVIREFERPLTQPRDPGPALRSRLRVKPHRSRLEVLLAPAPGRSYPNLSDHRKNVEYDMERVRHALGDEPFVSDSIRQSGEWVVLSFRARVLQKKVGAM